MAYELLKFALEAVGEVVLVGALIILFCAAACLVASPIVLVRTLRTEDPFWPSLIRSFWAVALRAARFADRFL